MNRRQVLALSLAALVSAPEYAGASPGKIREALLAEGWKEYDFSKFMLCRYNIEGDTFYCTRMEMIGGGVNTLSAGQATEADIVQWERLNGVPLEEMKIRGSVSDGKATAGAKYPEE